MPIETRISCNCLCCRHSFSSILSQNLSENLIVGNVAERCPHCGCDVFPPKGKIVLYRGELRFLPIDGSATLCVLPNLASPDLKEVYFSVGDDDSFHSTWKLWKNKRDIYLSCREFEGVWKVSIHESGQDSIGFVYDFDANKNVSTLNGRYFFKMARAKSNLAYLTRILQISFRTRSGWNANFPNKPMSPKSRRRLKIITPTGINDDVHIDLCYSSDHPNEFKELRIPPDNLLALMSGGQGEYFYLLQGDPFGRAISSSIQDRVSIPWPSNSPISDAKMMITLGKTDGQSILIEVMHF